MKTLIFAMLVLAAMPAAAAPEAYAPEPDLSAALAVPDLPFLDRVAGEDESVANERLALARGREGGDTSATLGGMVTGNSATYVSTGANLITDGAFANMSGLPVVIQNSGANVLIQNATVINLQFR